MIGYFALDMNKKYIFPDSNTLTFARRERKNVKWYGAGKIQINDIIIYVGSRGRQTGVYETAGINKCDCEPESDCIEVVIFRYDDKDFLPFFKRLEGEKQVETVYSDESIDIRIRTRGNEISLELKAGSFVRREERIGQSGHMTVIKQGRIAFFSRYTDTDEDIRKLLAGGVYKGYMEDNGPVEIGDFFGADLARKILSLENDRDTVFFDSYGKPAAVRMVLEQDILEGRKLFSIGMESAFRDHIKAETYIYDRLYFADRIKIGDNELGCEARLRGCGENIEKINRQLDKVCRKNVTIVLTGESGTGKTFLAGEIHRNSRRSDGPFINVNCAAIAYNLIESELFGYEEGAFTGARKGGKIGYFEMARGGTLFLDEISELPFLLQGKLLEVLQEGTFYRVGGIKKISADVRLIVATNKNLEEMVRTGRFREDLYYRINVFPIHLPPLRERINDLESIAGDTLPHICERLETDNLMLTNEALEKMKGYSWPGNIRELENVLEKAAVMAEGSFIRKEDIILDNPIAEKNILLTLKEKMEAYEKELIKETFEKFRGNRRRTAEALGISKTNLFEKIRKYNIDEKNESGEI